MDGDARDEQLRRLNDKIDRLCARCEHLHRDNNALRQELRQLQRRRERAQQALGKLISTLPEYEQ